MSRALSILFQLFCVSVFSGIASEATVLFSGQNDTQCGVHGKGNVYAPEVHFHDGKLWMWFGGQGRDGHDRIHLAQSENGKAWKQLGVVLDNGSANHVNDPSVVRVNDEWWMFYTVAKVDVVDEIALATSTDGVHWKKRGVVLAPSAAPDWDSLLVGRPSVLHENGVFKMWYDGCKDLPPNAPAKNVPKSASSRKCVGYAESRDGLKWKRKFSEPVMMDATAVQVSRAGNGFVMVYESHAGTQYATSQDGIKWKQNGLLAAKGSECDRFGHVTPFLFLSKNQPPTLYFGAARENTWDVNCMAMMTLSEAPLVKNFEDQLSK